MRAGRSMMRLETTGGHPPLGRVRTMATWDDVRRIALALPETSERLSRDLRQWLVRDKGFVWERPLRRADVRTLGDDAPGGPILGARVEHLGAKDGLLADDSGRLRHDPALRWLPGDPRALGPRHLEDLDEVIVEAWLARAPKRLAAAYLATLR